MPNYFLSKKARADIQAAIDQLFERAKIRLLSRSYQPKRIAIGIFSTPPSHREDLSIPGAFDQASKTEGPGMVPNPKLRQAVQDSVESYLDSYKAAAKARVLAAVQAHLHDAEAKGGDPDTETVLGGRLADIMGTVTQHVRRMVETETTRAANVGTIDPISKVNLLAGVGDPTVYFVGPNDSKTCPECRRMFFMADGITPRCWLMSEVRHGQFKKGDATPTVGGTHPNCRHRLTTILRGYGFEAGKITYVAPGYDVLAQQRAAKP